MVTALKVGVAGLGTVGAALIAQVARQQEALAARCGRPIEVAAVCARSRAKDRGVDLKKIKWFSDPGALARAGDIDVFVVRRATVAEDDAGWTDAVDRWADRARTIAGIAVNLIEADEAEVPKLLKRRGGSARRSQTTPSSSSAVNSRRCRAGAATDARPPATRLTVYHSRRIEGHPGPVGALS